MTATVSGAPLLGRLRPDARPRATLIAGAILTGVILVIAGLGPLLLPSPTDQNVQQILAMPSEAHLLGTDQLGRDLLSRVVNGMRIDLLIGFGALLVPLTAGSLLGALAGWYGGWLERVTGVISDVVQAFPYYLLIIVLVFFLGSGVGSIFVAVAVVAWVSYLRIVRAEVLSARGSDYVQAALGAGYSTARVLLRHILPNAYRQALTFYISDVVLVIVSTATLSYFGLGIAPPAPELGALIADGQQFIAGSPLLSIAPGIAVVVMGVALSLLGNGLAEQLEES